MSRTLDVTLLQVGYGDGERKRDRVDRVVDWLRHLEPADLIVLPELWAHGGFASDTWADSAELLDGETVTRLAGVACELRTWIHAGSIIERAVDGANRGDEGRGLWNTSILLSPEGVVHANYRKVHRFGFGDGEPLMLEAGKDMTVTDVEFRSTQSRIGLATCYDLRFPELFRNLSSDGAELVVLPAAWPLPRVEHWRLLGRARALENQSWLLQCNTAGTHSGVEMGGYSQIVSPTGDVVCHLGIDEGVLTAQLDLDLVRETREAFPVLADRRL